MTRILVEVVALVGETLHHPAAAPVHGRRLADHDARLERVLDVVEAREPVAELLLQPGHVLPARLVRLAGDDADHLQLGRVVGLDDRLHRPLQHVVRLGVGRDDAEVGVLSGSAAPLGDGFPALLQPVHLHVTAQVAVGPPATPDDDRRAGEPVEVEDEDRDRHRQRPVVAEGERDPGGRQHQGPGQKTGCDLQHAVPRLQKRPGLRRAPGGGDRAGRLLRGCGHAASILPARERCGRNTFWGRWCFVGHEQCQRVFGRDLGSGRSEG